MEINAVIAAVRTEEEVMEVLESNVQMIFYLCPDLHTLKSIVDKVHKAGRKILIHFDLATGIGKDRSGLTFAKEIGVDGIVSTRVNIIKMARDAGLFTVQRFFIVDSHSVGTTIDALKASKADMIEIMPGVVPKVISDLKSKLDATIIAGGLIETKDEVITAIESGATAVSTGKSSLWNL